MTCVLCSITPCRFGLPVLCCLLGLPAFAVGSPSYPPQLQYLRMHLQCQFLKAPCAILQLQTSPDSSPSDSPRTPPPPRRGSTTSPGQEALGTAGQWLAVLVCCHHQAGLAPDGLALVNDLVQLLYYHGSGVAHSMTPGDCDTTVHLLSPVVQVNCHDS